MNYDIEKPSYVCYNDVGGKPNLDDAWVHSVEDVKKDYIVE